MALYTRDSIDRVREAVDMVELVGARTDLRRVGTRFTGLCPFHEERTPSFSVNAEHKLYHCFGCGASGDAIGFVQETEALDFKEAISERHGVDIPRIVVGSGSAPLIRLLMLVTIRPGDEVLVPWPPYPNHAIGAHQPNAREHAHAAGVSRPTGRRCCDGDHLA